MPKQYLAIANCRVSSDEQLQNNSLKRQREAVISSADKLQVIIPNDGWWSGSVSSKRGTNLKRKDLKEMLAYCKSNKLVKYLIVAEPDRFMRSIDEAVYFEVEFKKLGVSIWYAQDDELNTNDMSSKLMKFMKYFVAEGSNEERQRKSIGGQTSALNEGRYTFHPKAGYRKGALAGIHEIDEVTGPILKECLMSIIEMRKTPTKALAWLNTTPFMSYRKQPLKMDRFRKIVTDPYYAGIISMDKQVKVTNPNGLHKPLLTKDQHLVLLDIMNNKKKNQKGPRKNGNPKFPLSNMVTHETCSRDKGNVPRVAGFTHSNGVSLKVYEKYRCRACGDYWQKDYLHEEVTKNIKAISLTKKSRGVMIEALEDIWAKSEEDSRNETLRLQKELKDINIKLDNLATKFSDPSNDSIQDVLMSSIKRLQNKQEEITNTIDSMKITQDNDRKEFMEFALSFVGDISEYFLDPSISKDLREQCKQLVFPSGFYIDSKNKVYTTDLSILFRGNVIKKSATAPEKAHMVRVRRL